MMTPQLNHIDHIHIQVSDRPAAESWYKAVLGLRRKASLESWAVPHGPLMLENESGTVVFALFQRKPQEHDSTIALNVSGQQFLQWCEHLAQALAKELPHVDHGLAWSIYFDDPDGNPFEITTYDYDFVRSARQG